MVEGIFDDPRGVEHYPESGVLAANGLPRGRNLTWVGVRKLVTIPPGGSQSIRLMKLIPGPEGHRRGLSC